MAALLDHCLLQFTLHLAGLTYLWLDDVIPAEAPRKGWTGISPFIRGGRKADGPADTVRLSITRVCQGSGELRPSPFDLALAHSDDGIGSCPRGVCPPFPARG